MTTSNVTCRLDDEVIAFLDKLGTNLDRDRSYLIRDAVTQYVTMHRWQIEEIEKALGEADRGEFATPAQVEAAFKRWTHAN